MAHEIKTEKENSAVRSLSPRRNGLVVAAARTWLHLASAPVSEEASWGGGKASRWNYRKGT